MVNRIIITDGNWDSDTLILLPRPTLPHTLAAAREGAHTGMSNTNTGGLALKALRQVGAHCFGGIRTESDDRIPKPSVARL